jgi:dihydrofolate synthase / folylpolyglutamate synthase
MRFDSLSEWLSWQETLHFTEVDPGLERVKNVWQQMEGATQLPFKVITVAGTNGKGSSVAILDAILRSAGYKTGTYTSPHLLRYNERIMVNGQACEDDLICQTFDKIDNARLGISLTYFEFATLAAVDIFCQQHIDIAILEVGMGGRLDAVNLFDADIALITPISLDHVTWLGNDRETIAFEKAGIIRPHHPVVCSESSPPKAVINHANSLQSPVFIANQAFNYSQNDMTWNWSNPDQQWSNLPLPNLAGRYQLQNAAAVLQVIGLLIKQDYDIKQQAIELGLNIVRLAGRFQKIAGPVEHIFDVTHNKQGADNLAELLSEQHQSGKTIAVLAMLQDKDVSAVATALAGVIDIWWIAGLDCQRGMSADELADRLKMVISEDKVEQEKDVEQAYRQALSYAKQGDRLLIFGSFHTVEAVMTVAPNLLD